MKKQPLSPQIPKGRQVSVPAFFPSPVAGWNTRDPLTAMRPEYARVLENFYPTPSAITLRMGCESWRNTGKVSSFVQWNGATSKLFTSTAGGFVDVTARYGNNTPVFAAPQADWSYCNMSTIGGQFMVAVSGYSDVILYDGTTWKKLNSLSTPAITGVQASQLSHCAVLRNRIWFVQKNSLDAWYLPAGQIAGELTKFPLGNFFSRGGYLVSCASWTLDDGKGNQELSVFVSSVGEVAVYSGTDPSTAGSWTLVGVFYVGAPLGKHCFAKFGGDLLLLCQTGLFPLSKAVQSSTINYSQALTAKIDPTFSESAGKWGNLPGWGITVFPKGSALLVNVPTSNGVVWQYVMNTLTGAWCKFTGWEAAAFTVFKSDLWMGDSTGVAKAWSTYQDRGQPITAVCRQAFTTMVHAGFRNPGVRKRVQMIRPLLTVDGTISAKIGLDTDYLENTQGSVVNLSSALGSLWGTAIWGAAKWGSGALTKREWHSTLSRDFFSAGIFLSVSSPGASFTWAGTDLLVQKGGVL